MILNRSADAIQSKYVPSNVTRGIVTGIESVARWRRTELGCGVELLSSRPTESPSMRACLVNEETELFSYGIDRRLNLAFHVEGQPRGINRSRNRGDVVAVIVDSEDDDIQPQTERSFILVRETWLLLTTVFVKFAVFFTTFFMCIRFNLEPELSEYELFLYALSSHTARVASDVWRFLYQ